VLQSVRARMLRRYSYDRTEMLERAVSRLSRARAPRLFSVLWTDAIFGWGNERWTAEAPYLSEVVRAAEKTSSSILECGSGLTTLLMGAIASRRGIQLHALEHNADWHARVTEAIESFGLTNVTVHLAPLKNFGSFDWYDVSLDELPNDFSLVVCDGPPGVTTRGGRSGMLPMMRGKMAKAFSILIDDTNRDGEGQLAQLWGSELKASLGRHAGGRGFARIVVRAS
jgi:Methyltransferase domain